MKKSISLLLAFAMLFSLCACSKEKTEQTTNESAEQMPNAQEEIIPDTSVFEQAENPTEIEATDITAFSKDEIGQVIIGADDENAEYGRVPLEKVSYQVSESSPLSKTKVCHSHGPASGGQPHYTVVEFQKTFDKYGALTLDTQSKEKVLYLTFDCGWEHNNLTSRVLDVLSEKDVPAAFFCTLDHIKKQPELIKRMIDDGHIVGNHSATHPSFAEINRTKMAKEIEDTENYLRENFGYCAKYFRFPAGEYNESALDLVSSLGYMSVFWSVAYNDWNVNEIKGKDYAVETVTQRLHSGAVILLHSVSQDNADALGEIIDTARSQGYVFKSLTEYQKA